jgi:uncharacterized protein (DUF1778 family)
MADAILKEQSDIPLPKTFFQGRVPVEVKQRWQIAANMRGQSLTDFLIVAANNAAENVFEAEERITLSVRDQQKLADMLSRPPKLNKRMRVAVQAELMEMRKN